MDAHLARFESVLASQDGLITLGQLRDGGLGEERIRRLVVRNVLRRVRPRVFGLVGAGESWERGLLAAVLSVEGAAASHSSAARLWRFAVRPEDRYEITVGREIYVTRRGVGIHRSGTIDRIDVTNVERIPCTSFERTVCDCTTILSPHQLGRVIDDGLRRRVASLPRLRDCLERTESAPGRHMSVIRALLSDRGIGFEPGGSRSELDVLDVLRRAGLPDPVQQYRVKVGSKTYRPDFAWPEHKVIVEYYGLPFHIGASAVVADSQRLTALSADGWLPLVFTPASSDREIVERTTEALALRAVGRKIGA
jgi:very-short-patch-repair endonuclease